MMLFNFVRRFWILLFFGLLYIPLAIMFVLGFTNSTSLGKNPFSFSGFNTLFGDTVFLNSIAISVIIGFVSSLVAVGLAFLICVSLHQNFKRLRKPSLTIFRFSLANTDLFNALTIVFLFVGATLKLGLFSFFTSHVVLLLPYAIILVYPVCSKIDVSVIESSQDLGASWFKTLRKIYLPILFKTLVLTFLICFSLSLDDFIFSFLNSGHYVNVSVFIYNARIIRPFLYSFGAIVFVIILAIVAFIFLLSSIKKIKSKKILQIKKLIVLPKINKLSLRSPFWQSPVTAFVANRIALLNGKLIATSALVFILLGSAIGLTTYYLVERNSNSLVFFSFSGYLSDKAIQNYEDSSKVNVYQTVYDSSESFFSKARYTNFDVGMVSDYGTNYSLGADEISPITDSDKSDFLTDYNNWNANEFKNYQKVDNYQDIYSSQDWNIMSQYYATSNSNAIQTNLFSYTFPFASLDLRFLFNNNESKLEENPYLELYSDSLENKKVVLYDDPRDIIYDGIKIAQSINPDDIDTYQQSRYNESTQIEQEQTFVSFTNNNVDKGIAVLRKMLANNNTRIVSDTVPVSFIQDDFAACFTNSLNYAYWFNSQRQRERQEGRPFEYSNYRMEIANGNSVPNENGTETIPFTSNYAEDGFVLSKSLNKDKRKKAINFIASQFAERNALLSVNENNFYVPTTYISDYIKSSPSYELIDESGTTINLAIAPSEDYIDLGMFNSQNEVRISREYADLFSR